MNGDLNVFADVFNHLLMPALAISFSITAIGILIIRRLVLVFKTRKVFFPSRNYARVAVAFFYLSLLLSMNELIFDLNGFQMLFFDALNQFDYFLILFLITVAFVIFQISAYFCDIVGILIQYFVMKNFAKDTDKSQHDSSESQEISPKTDETNQFLSEVQAESQQVESQRAESQQVESQRTESKQADSQQAEPNSVYLNINKFNIKSILLRPELIIGEILLF
ncbi:hypothetical protein [Candidatus Harpocratesius sp.]